MIRTALAAATLLAAAPALAQSTTQDDIERIAQRKCFACDVK